MTIKNISPGDALQLISQGAILFDIREPADYAREHIAAARQLPLSTLAQGADVLTLNAQDTVIFHCQSGMRSAQNAEKLASVAAPAITCLMEGGINAWKQQGLAVVTDRSQPLPIMRQVQMAAGSLVLIGVILGYIATPGWFLLSGLVGAGLLFAGISGHCGMATLLAKMPWNRPQH